MNQPQLIAIDPYMIQFSSQNPRRHQGTEFERLKQSVREVGLVQLPTVRALPGGGYEVIDGEGRIRAAKEKGDKTIWVVSLGIVDEKEAHDLLMAANTVRYFGFLAECRGVADMFCDGESEPIIAAKLGLSQGYISVMVAVGAFPPNLLDMIQGNLLQPVKVSSEESRKIDWNFYTLRKLLPLRQIRPGEKSPTGRNGESDHAEMVRRLKESYDYTEVQHAIEHIIAGNITTGEQLNEYIAARRLLLYEQNFNEELRVRLDEQLESMKQSLKDALMQQMEGATEETIKEYDETVNRLRTTIQEREAYIEKLRKDVARNPQVLVEREQEAEKKAADAQKVMEAYLNSEKKLNRERTEFQQEKQEIIAKGVDTGIKQRLAPEREKLLNEMQEMLDKRRHEMDSQFSEKEKALVVRTSNELNTMFARGIQHMAQTRVWLLNLVAPDVIQQLDRLSQEELASLASEIITMRRTLDAAIDVLRHGRTTVSEDEENYVNA